MNDVYFIENNNITIFIKELVKNKEYIIELHILVHYYNKTLNGYLEIYFNY